MHKPSFTAQGIVLSATFADITELMQAPDIWGAVVMRRCSPPESRYVMTKRPLISIVEDDQLFRESMRRITTSLGYAVEDFPSSAAFLASPLLPKTDCLVADVQMPGMTGVELHKHIVDAGYEIPTILMTAYPDAAVQSRALKNGVVCYLNKPLDDDCFEQCLRSALKLDSPRQENL